MNWKLLKPIGFGLLAALALLPIVNAQGVAPAVSLMVNGNPVSTSNPLPVTGDATSAPQATPAVSATACGAALAVTTPPAAGTIVIPTCSPGPSLPLSVANGGTGTAAPSPQATATSCGQPAIRTGTFPSQVIQVPVCATTPPSLYASTGQASPGPTGTPYLLIPCGTGSTNCSSGVLTVTTGVNNSGTGQWIGTVQVSGQLTSALTSETITYCVAGSPAVTVLDGDHAGTCRDALTNRFMGSTPWGTTPSLNGGAVAHILIPNSTSQTISCYVDTSTATLASPTTWCSILVTPY